MWTIILPVDFVETRADAAALPPQFHVRWINRRTSKLVAARAVRSVDSNPLALLGVACAAAATTIGSALGISWGELVPLGAMCLAIVPVSALGRHIAHVVAYRAKPKMVWVYAWGIVARVADAETAGDGAILHLPRRAMGSHGTELAISIRLGTEPRPAFVWSAPVNLRPKALLRLGGHRDG